MGGLGSGPTPWRPKKTTVEQCLTLSVFDLYRHGVFQSPLGLRTPGSIAWAKREVSFWLEDTVEEGLCLRLAYKLTQGGVSEDLDYLVHLQTTSPHFGGVRYWLTCPLITDVEPCRRRVGKLYLPPRGHYFGCRTCHDLTYRSAQEHDARVDLYRRNPEALIALLRGSDERSTAKLVSSLSLARKVGLGRRRY